MNTGQSTALGSCRELAARLAAAAARPRDADWNHKRSVNETWRLSARRRSASLGGPACNYALHYSGSRTSRTAGIAGPNESHIQSGSTDARVVTAPHEVGRLGCQASAGQWLCRLTDASAAWLRPKAAASKKHECDSTRYDLNTSV